MRAVNQSPDKLSQALHELAEASPRSAPPELGVSLKDAFARHHARRQQRKVAFVVALAACLALAIAILRNGKLTPDTTAAKKPGQSIQVPNPQAEVAAAISDPVKTETHPAAKPHVSGRKRKQKPPSSEVSGKPITVASGDFVALPTFDPALPVAQSRLLRVELPGPALQLMGYPIDGRLLNRHVLTDLLVGQDGMPYAVRLVQTSNTH